MSEDTKLKELIINTLSPDQFAGIVDPSTEEIYLVEDDAEYATVEELAQKQDKSDALTINNVLEAIYPVGAIYIGTTTTCPIASLLGTWEIVAKDKALWTGDGTNANTTIDAGLPNVKGNADIGAVSGTSWGMAITNTSGAIGAKSTSQYVSYSSSTTPNGYSGLVFNASQSNSIYSDDVDTVQPPAYVVNVWRRTA